MGVVARVVIALAVVVVVPAAAYAQASIAGTVRDSSGAVMPGVTVEATSPDLIERVRTVVTDGGGQYRIITLPPGTYAVTFTLPGFSTIRREGLELTGTFTATVNAELRVGALEETVTVTSETPLVDVQTATQQRVIGHEIVDVVPNGRMPSSMIALIPGITVAIGAGNWYGLGAHDVGGTTGDIAGIYAIHGGQLQDSRMTLNGVSTGWGNEAFETGFSPNMSALQEVVVNTAASAESEVGGVTTNLIPRDGGNVFSGTFAAAYTNEHLAADNITDSLRARGLFVANSPKMNMDINPGIGGPIRPDTLWFYGSVRYLRADNYVAGVFVDRTQDDPSVFTYNPDPEQQAFNSGIWKSADLRLTWQATQRHKLAWYYSQQTSCKCPSLISATQPNGTENRWGLPQRIVQMDWTAPLTNRLLVDAAALHQINKWGFFPRSTSPIGLIGLTEQTTGANLKTRSGGYRNAVNETLRYRVSASYVTGAHAFKIGAHNAWAMADYNVFDLYDDRYRVNNGIPNQIIMRVRPYHDLWTLDAQPGVFVQDKWTIRRLTLNLGARYDYMKSHFPEQTIGDPDNPYGASRYITQPFVVPETPQLHWHDITPKMALAYDLFGTGKTAVKASLNKYLNGQQVDPLGNPVAEGLVLQTTRNWNDANRNFIPDCDLLNVAANGECAAMADPNFGKTRRGREYDPETLGGWGHRGYNWELSAGVQHEVLSGLSVDVSYFRRSYGNLLTTDDRAISPADFDTFSITAPSDPRLPDGGSYTVSGLVNLKPASFGRPANELVTFAGNYGEQIQQWNGVDVSVNARVRDGLLLQGGLSTGRTTTDNCEVVAALPEQLFAGTILGAANAGVWLPQAQCHQESPFLTQVKFLGSYTIPTIDVQISGTFQSIPGPHIAASYVASNAVVAPSLGRPLSGGAANITVNIVPPGSLYGDRLNQLDLRFGKRLRLGGTHRASLNVDLYNVFNRSPVLQLSNVYGNWQSPQGILIGRNVKFGVQYDF